MSADAPTSDSDPSKNSADEGAPTTLRDTGRAGRGTVLAGKYRLEMLLGEGGMAVVWSAYHLELELPVAIKLLRAGPDNDRLAQRLRHEARAVARLVSPSIVRVFDVARADNGDPFIVMELLTGESLASELRRGPIGAVRAVQLLLPIAEALSLSHASGIVHRDLKPDNIFLSTDGQQLQPKLLDFGIAKLARVAAKLTEQGTTLGSPNYMSPEQVRGDDVDFATDVWSFCVLLYKAVTGSAPFYFTDRLATLDAIMHGEPKPLPHDTDAELARLMLWGLTKNPAQRPGSMRELGQRLAQWLVDRGVDEDITGAPLGSKWLSRSMAAPAPAYETLTPSVETLAVPTTGWDQRTQRIVPTTRRRRWAPFAAAAMLLASGSLASSYAVTVSQRHAAEVAVRGPAPVAPLLLAAARPEPELVNEPEMAPPPAPVEPSVVAPEAASEPPARSPVARRAPPHKARKLGAEPSAKLPF
ncbi:MAG TPA: serine/threonine-protein kinase [Polyangiaceae bacterium]|nr:serine/threonine-protein kinase [Polyangiaceae bacterium]